MKLGRGLVGVSLAAGALGISACSGASAPPVSAPQSMAEQQLGEWERKAPSPTQACLSPRNKGFAIKACLSEAELKDRARAACGSFVDFHVLNTDECPQTDECPPRSQAQENLPSSGSPSACGVEAGNVAAFVCCEGGFPSRACAARGCASDGAQLSATVDASFVAEVSGFTMTACRNGICAAGPTNAPNVTLTGALVGVTGRVAYGGYIAFDADFGQVDVGDILTLKLVDKSGSVKADVTKRVSGIQEDRPNGNDCGPVCRFAVLAD